ncbi:unnamed protein product [Hymenolepis diminuta]|uniref:Uncharacterized protein n=1 Tax=Hymenolepis diminuta TaxID=6216 RepID=A0A564YCB1_HYMDI|nr:unnamed protein product [Hymenolepis diminuta]
MPSSSSAVTISALDRMVSRKFCCWTLKDSSFGRNSKNDVDKILLITANRQAERFVGTFKRTLEKIKEEVSKFLLTNRTAPHPVLGDKSPTELLMGRTVSIINQAIIPMDRTNDSEKSYKIGAFNADDPMFACDFRITHS